MFHFMIRDMLWLTVVVAVVLGWWVEHVAHQQAEGRLQVVEAMQSTISTRKPWESIGNSPSTLNRP
jgi:hypothetical protein